MTEIRITGRKDPREEYRDYPYAVQLYHTYDVYMDDLSEDPSERKRYANRLYRKQLIILAGMNDQEYRELQRSLQGHAVQKRIEVNRQHQELLKLAGSLPDGKIYTYCVEEVSDDMSVPLAVFDTHDLDRAKDLARDIYMNEKRTVQICEGLYDLAGNIPGDTKLSFIIEVYGKE